MIEATKLYILIGVLWPWPSFKVKAVWEIRNYCAYLLTNFAVGMNEIQDVATTWYFVEGHA